MEPGKLANMVWKPCKLANMVCSFASIICSLANMDVMDVFLKHGRPFICTQHMCTLCDCCSMAHTIFTNDIFTPNPEKTTTHELMDLRHTCVSVLLHLLQ